jgi:hypothetical protein
VITPTAKAPAAKATNGIGQVAPSVNLDDDQAAIFEIIVEVAKANGIAPDAFAAVGWIESRFRADAYNRSGASGVFQFMPGTANGYGLADPFDARANIEAAARLWNDNAAFLSRKLGREPSAAEIYLAHQQGAGGAFRLLSGGSIPAREIVGRAAVVQNLTGTISADVTANDFAVVWAEHFARMHALFAS